MPRSKPKYFDPNVVLDPGNYDEGVTNEQGTQSIPLDQQKTKDQIFQEMAKTIKDNPASDLREKNAADYLINDGGYRTGFIKEGGEITPELERLHAAALERKEAKEQGYLSKDAANKQSIDVDVPDAQTEQQAAIPSPYMATTGKSSQYISAALGKKEGLDGIKKIEEHRDSEIGRLRDLEDSVDGITKKHTDIAIRRKEDLDKYKNALGGRADKFFKKYEEADVAFQQAREKIERSQINPNRIFSSMPTAGRVFVQIGAAIENALSIARTGKSGFTYKMIEKAIDRDVSIQKDRLNRLMDQASLDRAERNQALSAFQQVEGQQRDVMKSLFQINLGELAADEKNLHKKQEIHNIMGALNQGAVKQTLGIQKAMRGRSTTTTQKQLVTPAGPGGASAEIDKTMARKFAENLKMYKGGITAVDNIKGLLSKTKDGRPMLGDKIPNTVATKLGREMLKIALAARKQMGDSGPITESDVDIYEQIKEGRITSRKTIMENIARFQKNTKVAIDFERKLVKGGIPGILTQAENLSKSIR